MCFSRKSFVSTRALLVQSGSSTESRQTTLWTSKPSIARISNYFDTCPIAASTQHENVRSLHLATFCSALVVKAAQLSRKRSQLDRTEEKDRQNHLGRVLLQQLSDIAAKQRCLRRIDGVPPRRQQTFFARRGQAHIPALLHRNFPRVPSHSFRGHNKRGLFTRVMK